MDAFTVSAKPKAEGIRISEFLKGLGFSSSLITKVKYGNVYLNGTAVHMRSPVFTGDTVKVIFPEESSEGIEPIDIPLEILYEDSELLAVVKPRNMPTHPSKGNSLPTLANAVMAHYMGRFVFRAVTRLDRDTSGIVIIAKNPLSCAKLSESMKRGEFKKYYTAVVSGVPSEPHAIIDAPIKREREGNMKRIVSPDGKRAITEYWVREILNGFSVCDILLHTGRTHQIRVHMAHIGNPLLNDFLYGERGDEGYMLHCTRIELPHPITNEKITLTSDFPYKM